MTDLNEGTSLHKTPPSFSVPGNVSERLHYYQNSPDSERSSGKGIRLGNIAYPCYCIENVAGLSIQELQVGHYRRK